MFYWSEFVQQQIPAVKRMKKLLTISALSFFSVQSAYINQNQLLGLNNVVYYGQNNKVNGKDNQVGGFSNVISGNVNTVYGDVNDLSGNLNLVQGSGNSVSGTGNLVSGQGNIVVGQYSSPQDKQKVNNKLVEMFSSRGLGGQPGNSISAQASSSTQQSSASSTNLQGSTNKTQTKVGQPKEIATVQEPVKKTQQGVQFIQVKQQKPTKVQVTTTETSQPMDQPNVYQTYKKTEQAPILVVSQPLSQAIYYPEVHQGPVKNQQDRISQTKEENSHNSQAQQSGEQEKSRVSQQKPQNSSQSSQQQQGGGSRVIVDIEKKSNSASSPSQINSKSNYEEQKKSNIRQQQTPQPQVTTSSTSVSSSSSSQTSSDKRYDRTKSSSLFSSQSKPSNDYGSAYVLPSGDVVMLSGGAATSVPVKKSPAPVVIKYYNYY